ncbi:MAG: hypothetical protein ACLR13_08195 [Acutalibacteraceae bacterium]
MRFVRHPLLIAHKWDIWVANTKAMEQMHLDKTHPDPAGGKYGRDENGNQLDMRKKAHLSKQATKLHTLTFINCKTV